jgi:type I restriction enzyme S subunit
MNYQIVLPDDETLGKFCEIIRPMQEVISMNNRENKRLEEIHDTVLPRLMKGEIKSI